MPLDKEGIEKKIVVLEITIRFQDNTVAIFVRDGEQSPQQQEKYGGKGRAPKRRTAG